MAKNKAISQSQLAKFVLFISIIFSSFITFKFLAVAIRDLRPIADDYCNATAANMSIFSNINYWFNLWSGDVFQTVIAYTFVSKPLLELPFGIGSAFPFVVGLLLLTLVIYKVLKEAQVINLSRAKNGYLFFATFVLVTGSWIAFWWLPIFTSSNNQTSKTLNEQYFLTILSWQTVNSPYVIQTVISFLLSMYVLKLGSSKKSAFFAAIIGILVGTSGYVLAVTLTFFILIETFSKLEEISLKNLAMSRQVYFYTFFVVIGMWISGSSPGALNRKSYLTTEPNYGALFGDVTKGILDWFDSVFSVEVVYLVILGAVIFSIFNRLGNFKESNLLGLFAIRLIFLSFVIYQVSVISEIFSYKAFWHTIFSSVFLYLGSIIIGATVMSKLSTSSFEIYKPIQLTILASTLLVSTYALNQAETRIEDRRAKWDVEPAPAPNGQPADREQMWINDCWLELRKLKLN